MRTRPLAPKACPSIIGTVAFAAAVAFSCPTGAAEPDSEQEGQSRFRDPDDDKLDLSAFLASAYGFVPLLVPITDPAVGYGAVAAAMFVHGEPPAQGEPFVRPSISVVGGLRTENDTRGWFGANLGTWRGGRVRTIAALADMDVNLEFFGLGGDAATAAQGLGYSVKARGGVAGGNYRFGDSQFWMGLRYTAVDTRVSLEPSVSELPNVPLDDYDLRLGALTPSLTLDRRDNFFTPIRGWYVDLSVPMYRESLSSDRDFETANLTGMYFWPFAKSLFLSLRASGKYSSDRTPFFLRPYVSLRGVQALQYQGERTAELEAELRWQFRTRWSVLGFVGAGEARSSVAVLEPETNVSTAGAGFRYLIARLHGLHLGVDVADGPDDTIFYVVLGNAWLRP